MPILDLPTAAGKNGQHFAPRGRAASLRWGGRGGGAYWRVLNIIYSISACMHGFKGEPFTVLDKKMLIRDSAKRFLVNWTHLGTSATGQHVSLSGLDFAELFEFFKSLRCLLLFC